MTNSEPIDFFWSFRSHYCYLALDRVMQLERDYRLTVRFRPVLPLAIRMPEFFAAIPRRGPNPWHYVMRDTERTAERLGLPFGWPDPDPITMNMETFEIAAEQPYIYRLTRLGAAAAQLDLGLAFAAAVAPLIFGGHPGWDQGSTLRDAVAKAGLDLDQLDAGITANPDKYDALIEANQMALNTAGHWGVPTLVWRDEPFFGQDRIADCRWRIEQGRSRP